MDKIFSQGVTRANRKNERLPQKQGSGILANQLSGFSVPANGTGHAPTLKKRRVRHFLGLIQISLDCFNEPFVPHRLGLLHLGVGSSGHSTHFKRDCRMFQTMPGIILRRHHNLDSSHDLLEVMRHAI